MTQASCLIAFDAAGGSCGAAVWRDGKILAEKLEEMHRGQAERLVPMIEEVLAQARVSHGALDALAVTVGPGAFTGVRIGLAAARGYALALGLPQIGVTTFEALAEATVAGERAGRRLLVVIDAKRADFFCQLFNSELAPLGEPFASNAGDIASRLGAGPLLLAGDASAQALPGLEGFDCRLAGAAGRTQPSCVAKVAARRSLPEPDAPPPAPLYLRAPDVSKPKQPAG